MKKSEIDKAIEKTRRRIKGGWTKIKVPDLMGPPGSPDPDEKDPDDKDADQEK